MCNIHKPFKIEKLIDEYGGSSGILTYKLGHYADIKFVMKDDDVDNLNKAIHYWHANKTPLYCVIKGGSGKNKTVYATYAAPTTLLPWVGTVTDFNEPCETNTEIISFKFWLLVDVG